MSWYYESSGYGSGDNTPPWKKGKERDYNYSYHRGGRRAGGGRGGRNNNSTSGSESESPRSGRGARGRKFVWCYHCERWDWENAWFPCCASCGRRWGVPKVCNEPEGQEEPKKKPDITKEQREQAAQLCLSLSQVVGFDFTPLLAAHLPAVQVPKTEKEMENQKWAELRDARKDFENEKKSSAAKKADQHLANLQKQLEAATTKAQQSRDQAEEAQECSRQEHTSR